MARITVEDCLEKVGGNRFDLVVVAAKRARKLSDGSAESHLDWEDHKATVIALKEIEEGYVYNESSENEVRVDDLAAVAPAATDNTIIEQPSVESEESVNTLLSETEEEKVKTNSLLGSGIAMPLGRPVYPMDLNESENSDIKK